MSFDLGGFAGTFIGTLGAYVVARRTFAWQQKVRRPQLLARKYELAQRMANRLTDAHSKLMRKSIEVSVTQGEFNQYVEDVISTPLSKLQIEAAELQGGLFTFVYEALEEISGLLIVNHEDRKDWTVEQHVAASQLPMDREIAVKLVGTVFDRYLDTLSFQKTYSEEIQKIDRKKRIKSRILRD